MRVRPRVLGDAERHDGVVGCQRPCGGRRTCTPPRASPGVSRPEGLSAIMSKWLLPSRLETRTKESKTRASLVVEKPTGVMKVIDAKATAASTGPSRRGLSKSVILRTRKMVNYA